MYETITHSHVTHHLQSLQYQPSYRSKSVANSDLPPLKYYRNWRPSTETRELRLARFDDLSIQASMGLETGDVEAVAAALNDTNVLLSELGVVTEKLQEMIDLWWQEAEKYNVLPLDDSRMGRFNVPRPPVRKKTKLYTYYPGGSTVPEQLSVITRRRSHVISAHVEIPEGGAEGVIISQGGQFGGWAFFMKEGRLAFAENVLGLYKSVIISDEIVPAGACTLRFVFKRNRPNNGTGELYINERKIGEGYIPKRTPVVYSVSEGLNCGRSGHTPVSDLYTCPFPFTGTLEKVTIDVDRTRVEDLQEQLHAALAMQ